MKELYIIGAGGFGREVAWLVERINEKTPTWDIKGFIDDNKLLWNTKQYGYNVLGGIEHLKSLSGVYVVCAVGSTEVRKNIIENLSSCDVIFATIVDPSVSTSKDVKIGEGSIICAGTVITVNVEIGNHVIINLNCTVGHDVMINDCVTVYPGANISGNVEIGSYSELGTGMKVNQGKFIAPHTIIGAGTIVVNDCTEGGTYVGVPARKIK